MDKFNRKASSKDSVSFLVQLASIGIEFAKWTGGVFVKPNFDTVWVEHVQHVAWQCTNDSTTVIGCWALERIGVSETFKTDRALKLIDIHVGDGHS